MGSIAFALPVKPGMKDLGLKIADELTGAKSSDHHEGHVARGVKRFKLFGQKVPSEMVVIYIEADDIGKAVREHHDARETEFETWLGDMVEQVTGHRPQIHGGQPPSELLVDWHPQHGHSRGREHAHA